MITEIIPPRDEEYLGGPMRAEAPFKVINPNYAANLMQLWLRGMEFDLTFQPHPEAEEAYYHARVTRLTQEGDGLHYRQEVSGYLELWPRRGIDRCPTASG